jgi:transcriptional regulator CtsR
MLRLIKSGILTVIYLLNCKPAKRSFSDMPRPSRERLIDEWIISERDRKIMKRRFTDEISVEKIAEEFDMSPRGINYILKRCVKTIEQHL